MTGAKLGCSGGARLPRRGGVMATVLQFTARPTVQPRLRRLRQAQHMRGVELANTFGVDKATVGRWERGTKRIPPARAIDPRGIVRGQRGLPDGTGMT
jgi:DNA-binding XRE family transcriptional regulator